MGEGRGLSPQDVICSWLKSRTRKRMRISSEFLISWNSWDSSCLEATIGQSNQRLIQLIIDTEMEARSGDAVRFLRILWTGCSQDSWVFQRDSLRFCFLIEVILPADWLLNLISIQIHLSRGFLRFFEIPPTHLIDHDVNIYDQTIITSKVDWCGEPAQLSIVALWIPASKYRTTVSIEFQIQLVWNQIAWNSGKRAERKRRRKGKRKELLMGSKSWIKEMRNGRLLWRVLVVEVRTQIIKLTLPDSLRFLETRWGFQWLSLSWILGDSSEFLFCTFFSSLPSCRVSRTLLRLSGEILAISWCLLWTGRDFQGS